MIVMQMPYTPFDLARQLLSVPLNDRSVCGLKGAPHLVGGAHIESSAWVGGGNEGLGIKPWRTLRLDLVQDLWQRVERYCGLQLIHFSQIPSQAVPYLLRSPSLM
jgi:hypothetical protein